MNYDNATTHRSLFWPWTIALGTGVLMMLEEPLSTFDRVDRDWDCRRCPRLTRSLDCDVCALCHLPDRALPLRNRPAIIQLQSRSPGERLPHQRPIATTDFDQLAAAGSNLR